MRMLQQMRIREAIQTRTLNFALARRPPSCGSRVRREMFGHESLSSSVRRACSSELISCTQWRAHACMANAVAGLLGHDPFWVRANTGEELPAWHSEPFYYEVKWCPIAETRPTRNPNGITGWAELMRVHSGPKAIGESLHLHVCGHTPCKSHWEDSRYGKKRARHTWPAGGSAPCRVRSGCPSRGPSHGRVRRRGRVRSRGRAPSRGRVRIRGLADGRRGRWRLFRV